MNNALPIQQKNRTVIIDIIRGFALLGVLTANLAGFITFALPEDKAAMLITTYADKLTENFVSLFVDGKFIMIFSILFGYGFGVLIDNITSKGIHANAFFIRRMIILLFIGLIHLGIWWGEILNVYALGGLLMLLFKKVKTKQLLIYGLVILFVLLPVIQGFRIFLLPPGQEKLDSLLNQYGKGLLSGNLFEVLKSNYAISMYVFIERFAQMRDVTEALGKFLIGYFIYRSGYLKNIAESIILIRKVFKIALVIAMLYLIKIVVIEIFGISYEDNILKLIDFEFSNIGVLSLSTVYCTAIIQIYHRNNNLKLFNALAAVGMMSLTNYLSHTVFYVFFFYGFGLCMFGELHMQWIIPMAIIIYICQIFISRFWMKHFQFGPAEWIWRMLSYKKYIPVKKQVFPLL